MFRSMTYKTQHGEHSKDRMEVLGNTWQIGQHMLPNMFHHQSQQKARLPFIMTCCPEGAVCLVFAQALSILLLSAISLLPTCKEALDAAGPGSCPGSRTLRKSRNMLAANTGKIGKQCALSSVCVGTVHLPRTAKASRLATTQNLGAQGWTYLATSTARNDTLVLLVFLTLTCCSGVLVKSDFHILKM